MCLAVNRIIPDNYWNHDPSLRDKDGFTTSDFFSMNKMQTP